MMRSLTGAPQENNNVPRAPAGSSGFNIWVTVGLFSQRGEIEHFHFPVSGARGPVEPVGVSPGSGSALLRIRKTRGGKKRLSRNSGRDPRHAPLPGRHTNIRTEHLEDPVRFTRVQLGRNPQEGEFPEPVPAANGHVLRSKFESCSLTAATPHQNQNLTAPRARTLMDIPHGPITRGPQAQTFPSPVASHRISRLGKISTSLLL